MSRPTSDIFRLMFFAFAGVAIGGAAFAFLEDDGEAAVPPETGTVASETVAATNRTVEPTEPEVEPESAEPAPAVDMQATVVGAFGSKHTAYLHLVLDRRPGADVDSAHVMLEPARGVRVADVFGADWDPHGDGGTVEVGRLDAPSHAVVELTRRNPATGVITANLSFRDDRDLIVSAEPVELQVTSTATDPAVEVFVSQAMTNRALDQAERLRTQKQYDEALQVLEDARAWNTEVGLALRVGGRLDGEQTQLRRLRETIEEEKRRPKKRRLRPPKRSIAIMYGK